MERSKAMLAKLIITVLIALLGVSQVSCAKEQSEEVVIKKEEAVERPTEYVLPQHILDILQNNQVSYNVWKGRIEEHKKDIALITCKINIAQAHQGTDSSAIVHTLRTYLASVGVAYDDLVNWKPEGNKAVRKVPVKKE